MLREITETILSTILPKFDIANLKQIHWKLKNIEPTLIVLVHELELFNILTQKIQKSVIEINNVNYYLILFNMHAAIKLM